MKIRSLRCHSRFIITLCVIFILSIGFKIIVPVLKFNWHLFKEISLAAVENDLEKGEKKGDTDFKHKTEFTGDSYNIGARIPLFNLLVHSTSYAIDYISIHYYKITTPPPDFDSHTFC